MAVHRSIASPRKMHLNATRFVLGFSGSLVSRRQHSRIGIVLVFSAIMPLKALY